MSAQPLHVSHLVALADELWLYPPRTRERGRTYAAEGRVTDVQAEDGLITAAVRGGEEYYTTWEWRRQGGWQSLCTCPLGGLCKHAYALGCVVLAAARAEHRFDDPRLARILPSVALGAARPPARRPSEAGGELQRLRTARAEWERQSALDRLLEGAPVFGLSPYAPPLLDLLREPDPDLRCWRLATAIAELANGWIPAPLRPYAERPDLADRFVERERAALASELLDWAGRRSDVARRRLRLVFGLVERPDDSAQLVFEVRVTTPRLADAPRTAAQLQTLRAESLRDRGLFPPEQANVLDWLADHVVVADSPAAVGGPLFTTDMPLALLQRVADSPLAVWADGLDPALTARGGIAPGAPVRLADGEARLVPDYVQRNGTPALMLRFRWPSGKQRAFDEVVYVPGGATVAGRRASLVVADGALSPVGDEPPAPVLERFRMVGALPLDAERRAEFVGALASRFDHLRETLAAHSRIHPAVLSVALDLRSDDWLQIRLFAQSGAHAWLPGGPAADGAVLFEYTPERGWVRSAAASETQDGFGAVQDATAAPAGADAPGTVDAPGASGSAVTVETSVSNGNAAPNGHPTDDDVWVEQPDAEAAAPVLDWLRALPAGSGLRTEGGQEPSWPDRNVGWWMRATRRTMARFAEAWDERPEGAAYFGNERVRRLLGGGRGVVPRLRVGASGVDWLAISAEWNAEGQRLTEADLARLREATTRFVKLDSGWVRKDLGAEQEALAAALADLGIDPGGGEQRLTVWQIAGASPATLRTLEQLGGDTETMATLDRLREQIARFSGIPPVAVPAGLKAELRPYQRHGLDFLVHVSALGLGAVLADDMGLGKTVQALAWLLYLREHEPRGGPALVVCPASVVHNWAREAERFAPGLRVLLLTSGKSRHALRKAIPHHDLVVTTYALLRRDLDAWRDVKLRAAILDETQFIKNPDAAVSRAALELTARHRLALTGTPLENRALDLWSILAFVNPGYLGNRAEFSARYDRADAPPHARALLAAKLRPLLLRRTKQAVAPELPARIEERRDCELTTEQRQLYVAELQRSRGLLAQLSQTPGGLARNKITILAALTRLRQICCHPALAGGRAGLGSGKFDALFELLEPILAEGHKVLVFSQFVQCLKLLAADLRARGIRYHQLTGATTKREQVVAAFQDDPDPCVFLISLKAGGTGLNLTAASYVVLFDPWWNPAVEAQAIDRTHRIGQDRTVIAYRLLTIGTIEEKIWDLQQRKAKLVSDVLGESGFARALTKDDLEFLLT